jgi:flagellar protein FliS
MISAHYGARQYRRTGVQSATPLQLVVSLYDAAISSAATARDAMHRRDIPARRDALNRTMDIVGELQGALDLDRGGKIAADLDGLYTYVLTRLLEAIARQDAAPIDDAHRILVVLRDGWRQIAEAQTAAPEGSAT